MTAISNDPSIYETPGINWRRQIRFGLIGALSTAFISLAGMPVGLDGRSIIQPVLSMGYLSLLWVPFVFASIAGSEVVLEGMAERQRSARDLWAGALVGLGSSGGVVLLMILIQNFDLRDPLVNWSPQLLELLSFDRSAAFGMVIWLVLGTFLGFLGGSMHVVPQKFRSATLTVCLSVLGVSVLETFLTDLLEGFGLEGLTDLVYYKRGGLEVLGAVVVAALALAVPLIAGPRVARVKTQVIEMPSEERRRVNLALLAVSAALLFVLPFFLGKITNELLANVGLFVLLALGLNIVVGLAGILDLGYVAFFAVGGYTTAVLTSPNSPGFSPELPWPVALIAVVILTGLVGLFIGAPVIRMRGDYLAIVTLGFGEIIRLLFLSDWLSGWFGGAQGITNIPGVNVGIATVKGTDPRSVFLLVLLAYTYVLVQIFLRILPGSRQFAPLIQVFSDRISNAV
ncbi:MAG: branched-chain amino acid ABC transporter permease [Acidimicrobiales bacterium]